MRSSWPMRSSLVLRIQKLRKKMSNCITSNESLNETDFARR
jgi:hypothetical protein